LVESKTVVLASGVRPSAGGLKAALNLLIGPGTQGASQDFAGKQVASRGGGDNAFENYLFIKNRGAVSVDIYARSIRARKEFLESVPVSDVYVGQYSVNEGQSVVSGRQYDKIVVLYGWEPHLPYVKSLGLARDPRGFVLTDPDCQTTVLGVFAIGEVAQRMHPCCITSMADGVVAAKAIQRSLERDAVTKFVATAKRASGLLKQMALG
jgi:thioredoxin reductase